MIMFNKYNTNNSGFTLIELLIAMAITTIVFAGMFSVYKSQADTNRAQKQVLEMQQNSRMALYMMTNEIRMAGYDYERTNGAGITAAGDGSIGNPLTFTFVADDDGVDNDGDSPSVVDEPGELKTVAFALYDGYGDGDTDIGRAVGAGALQPLAENIERLVFTYFENDGTGMTQPIAATDLSNIKYIHITIEATIDSNETNYFNGNNRILETTVQCRNMGL
jgi:type IV pilus assembly protein PilW